MGFDIQTLIATCLFNKIIEISMPKLAKKKQNPKNNNPKIKLLTFNFFQDLDA